ncbi:MAG: site-2 protease family protein [Chloroflexota bacterium]
MKAQGLRFWRQLGRDQIFWLVIGGLFIVYALTSLRSVLPLLFTIGALVIAVTLHECAHAWSADRLGDPTARLMGRVSLNPLVHLDPMGTVMMVITALTGYGIGWGKPTPVSPHRLRYGSRQGLALVSLAGPASNLVLAVVVGLLLRLIGRVQGGWYGYVLYFLQTLVFINVVLSMFNLLPLPPLDGHAVLVGLFSLARGEWSWRVIQFLESLERFGPMLLFGLILFSQFLGLNLIGRVIGPPTRVLVGLILGA